MQNSAFDPAGTIQCFLSDFVGSAEKLTELERMEAARQECGPGAPAHNRRDGQANVTR